MPVSGRYYTNPDGDRFEYEYGEDGERIFRIITGIESEEVVFVEDEIDALIKFLSNTPTNNQPSNAD